MASRKDPRKRVLEKGEVYRSDGRYHYAYTDSLGKRRFIYANSLNELRAKEKNILVARWSGAEFYSDNVTLDTVHERYLQTRAGIKESTYATYCQTYDNHIQGGFGRVQIKTINYSDLLIFYGDLVRKRKLDIRSVEMVHQQIYATLELAVEDGYISRNPAKRAFDDFKKATGKKKRVVHGLTIEEQRAFLEFIDGHPVWDRYYPIFATMLGTGLRVGELCVLRWQDIDFEARNIEVNHALVYVKAIKGVRKAYYKVATPKTKDGIRNIPLINPVLDALKREFIYAQSRGFPTMTLDGYTDFVFTNRAGNYYQGPRLDKVLRDIVKDYNKQERAIARLEDRKPILLPHISNHTLRHTFCTRLCEADVNPKTIQKVMGHASISTTLGIYAEVSQKKVEKDMYKMAEDWNVF